MSALSSATSSTTSRWDREGAYQINEGTRDDPDFRDLARGTAYIALARNGPTLVGQARSAGRMEYAGLSKKKKNTGSFRIELEPQAE